MRELTTWRKVIKNIMSYENESFNDVVYNTLTDEELDEEFDCGFGGTNGKPFTLWTENRVYFPVQYDGSEWVASVPRNPSNEVTDHIGG